MQFFYLVFVSGCKNILNIFFVLKQNFHLNFFQFVFKFFSLKFFSSKFSVFFFQNFFLGKFLEIRKRQKTY